MLRLAMRLLAALLVTLAPLTAAAQTAPPTRPAATAATPARPGAPAAAPASAHEVTPFQAAINRGAQAFHDRQLDVAATAFRDAAGRDARSPVPQLLLGAVAQAQGNAANALGAYREAARIAQAEGDDASRARALAAIASVQEGQQRWDDARNAWQEYTTFADGHAQSSFPAVGRARTEAIGRRATLETEYAPVRERIAERLRINASGQNQQAPAGTVVVPVAPGSLPAGAVIPPSRGR